MSDLVSRFRLRPTREHATLLTAALMLALLAGCGEGAGPQGDASSTSSASKCSLANDYMWYVASISGQPSGDPVDSAQEYEQAVRELRGSLTKLEGVLPENLEDDRRIQAEGWRRTDKLFAEYDYDLSSAPSSVMHQYRSEAQHIGRSGGRLIRWSKDACGIEAPQGFPTRPAELRLS